MSYIYAVPDMKIYLNKRYGIAENYKGSKQKLVDKISNRQGILAFGHFHIDLWLQISKPGRDKAVVMPLERFYGHPTATLRH